MQIIQNASGGFIYDLTNPLAPAHVTYTVEEDQHAVGHFTAYELKHTTADDFAPDGSVIAKDGWTAGMVAGKPVLYKSHNIQVEVTATGDAHYREHIEHGDTAHLPECRGSNTKTWELGKDGRPSNAPTTATLTVKYTDLTTGAPFALPAQPKALGVDRGSDFGNISEAVHWVIEGVDTPYTNGDVSITARPGEASQCNIPAASAEAPWKAALSVTNGNVIDLDPSQQPAPGVSGEYGCTHVDVVLAVRKMTGYVFTYKSVFGHQDACTSPDTVFKANVITFHEQHIIDLNEKDNCGCAYHIGKVVTEQDGTVVSTTLNSNAGVTGKLTGDVDVLSSLHGLTAISQCSSPASVKGYEMKGCGLVVDVARTMYTTQFVDENGCELYIPGAQDGKMACGQEDFLISPPIPRNWEATGVTHLTAPDACNVITKQIVLRHKNVHFKEQLAVKWYDECGNERENLGYITRNVVEDLVTGARVYDQWDNTNVHLTECTPFVGMFTQEGINHDGDWTPLTPDRDWTVLYERADWCENVLRIGMLNLSQNDCDIDSREAGLCGFNLNNFKQIRREGSCNGCNGVCPELEDILYKPRTFESTCTTREVKTGLDRNIAGCCCKK